MSQRIEKVNELIKRELSQLILREINFSPNILITVTRFETSSDLRHSKAFISVMPEDKTKEVFQILNENIYTLQQKINKKLRMRPVPQIRFVNEKEVIKAARVDELLDKIKENY